MAKRQKKQKAQEALFSKEEMAKRGIVKTPDGYRKFDTLERFLGKGFLDSAYANQKYTPTDRYSAARRLEKDFYMSRFAGFGAIDYAKVKVNGASSGNLSEEVLDARQRYLTALRAISKHFLYAVRSVCLENHGPVIMDDESRLEKKRQNYLFRIDLCRGLDDLISFYQKKIKL